jgi:MoaA/NifB/PqqE/SkfB family radical SAM enzyme
MGVRYVLYLQRSGGTPAPVAVAASPPPTERQRANEELNKAEYAAGRLRLRSLPTALQLESTTKCNFACLTCSKGYDPYYAEDLSASVLEVVRRDLMPVNTHLSITGFGEPTLAGNFDEILEMGLRNGSVVQFVTNLSLLDFGRLERLTAHPVEIIISIDGATPGTFETVRAGGSLALTLEKLAMIRKLRDIRLSHFLSHFSFHFVALRRNVHELPDVGAPCAPVRHRACGSARLH